MCESLSGTLAISGLWETLGGLAQGQACLPQASLGLPHAPRYPVLCFPILGSPWPFFPPQRPPSPFPPPPTWSLQPFSHSHCVPAVLRPDSHPTRPHNTLLICEPHVGEGEVGTHPWASRLSPGSSCHFQWALDSSQGHAVDLWKWLPFCHTVHTVTQKRDNPLCFAPLT